MNPFSRQFVLATACAVLTFASLSPPAAAVQCFFNQLPVGNWGRSEFWSCLHIPTSADWVFVSNGGTALVTDAESSGLLEIGHNNIFSRVEVSTIQFGGTATLSCSSLLLHRGEVLVEGQDSTLNAGATNIGSVGEGVLIVRNGGVVNTNGFAQVGRILVSGTATVDGAASAWNANGGLILGDAEFSGGPVTGTLTLINGGIANVSGALTLAAAQSTGILNIGNGGAPGLLNAPSVNGGAGTATLNFNHNSPFYHFTSDGNFLSPPVAITGSTAVRHIGTGVTGIVANNTYTGGTTVKQGILLVREGGSINHPNALMLVGEESGNDATLEITGGGEVTDFFARVGWGAGSVGHVEASGFGSWTHHDGTDFNDLHLGLSGTGSLDVQGGFTVESRDGTLGLFAGGDGSAVVSGGGSRWALSRNMFVGGSGTGELTVDSGGTIDVDGIFRLAFGPGSTGTLNIGSGGAAGIVNAVLVEGGLDGSAALNFNHSDADYHFTIDGTSGGAVVAITGSTAVHHIGSGTTTLTGNHSYSGGTSIDAGKLLVDGTIGSGATVNAGGTLGGNGTVSSNVQVLAGGTLAPGGSVGCLTFNQGVAFNDGGTLEIEIAGQTPGSGYDQLTVTAGDVDLDDQAATLDAVASKGAFAPTARLFIIDNTGAGTTSGAFVNLPDAGAAGTPVPALAGLGGFVQWRIYYHADTAGGQLSGGNDVALIPVVPGDMNCDGLVDEMDIEPFALALTDPDSYGIEFANCGIGNGDTNCDGSFNGLDVQRFMDCVLTSSCGCP